MIRRRLFFSIFILLLVPVLLIGVSASSVSTFEVTFFRQGDNDFLNVDDLDLFQYLFDNRISFSFSSSLGGSDVSFYFDSSSFSIIDVEGIPLYLLGSEPPLGFTVGDPSFVYLEASFIDSIDTLTFIVSYSDVNSESSLLSDLSDTAGAFLSTVGQIVDSIVSSPLLLVTVGIFFLGGCVALLGRFLGKD